MNYPKPPTATPCQANAGNGRNPHLPGRPPLPSLLPDFPPPPWQTRRIVVSRTVTCHHCKANAFLLDPDLGATCIQCAKSPNSRPRSNDKEPFPL